MSSIPCQREAFSLPRDLHYLNCAYFSPLPRLVEDAGVKGLIRKRVPTGLTPEDFFHESDEIRRAFAALINVSDSRRVALLPSVSYGVAVAARNTPISGSQNIVVLHEQFPGNLYAWKRLADETRADLRTVVPPNGDSRGRIWNQRILEAIDSGTAVVAMPQVHWTDGTLFDLVEVGRRAREVGAALIVDATQSVGALPFDVEEIRPDALICAGYKWLFGPYSTAFGYFGPRYDQGVPLEETWIAREGSEDFRRLVDYQETYQPGAIRFDVGERSNFTLNPMVLAALGLVNEWDPGRIQSYCRELTEDLIRIALEFGFSLEEEGARASHILGVRMREDLDLKEVKEALDRARIFASLRGSALRVSPNVYNDETDIAALIEVLKGL